MIRAIGTWLLGLVISVIEFAELGEWHYEAFEVDE